MTNDELIIKFIRIIILYIYILRLPYFFLTNFFSFQRLRFHTCCFFKTRWKNLYIYYTNYLLRSKLITNDTTLFSAVFEKCECCGWMLFEFSWILREKRKKSVLWFLFVNVLQANGKIYANFDSGRTLFWLWFIHNKMFFFISECTRTVLYGTYNRLLISKIILLGLFYYILLDFQIAKKPVIYFDILMKLFVLFSRYLNSDWCTTGPQIEKF